MKPTLLILFALIASPTAVFAEEHKHTAGEEAHDHDHDQEDGDDHDHEHDEAKGPNGGKIVDTTATPFEVSVTNERKVRITFLDGDHKAIPAAEQSLTAVGGERKNPTRLAFSAGEGEEKGALISDKPLPEGEHVPLILQFKNTPDAEKTTVKMTLHLHH